MGVLPDKKTGLCQRRVCLQDVSDELVILLAFNQTDRVVDITVFWKRLRFLMESGRTIQI